MKIGITSSTLVFPDNIKIYSNGHHFNVLLWYHFFEKCGFEVVFISDKEESGPVTNGGRTYHVINYVNVWNNPEETIKQWDLDCLFLAGLTDGGLCKLMKKHNVYVIYSMMGNNYIYDIDTVIYDKDYNNAVPERNLFDEIWVSPHFEYSIEYYKIRYGMENILVGPYIWSDYLVKGKPTQVYNKGDKLNVAICEPNICDKKNCMIPICICEKGEQYIERMRCYCTDKLRQNKYFVSFASSLDIHKRGKAIFNNRNIITDILNTCNCVVSTTQECDLNYVFLECFYFGIPLIHNSKMLQDYGYYYPDLDISKGVEQMEKVVKTHDTKLYLEKHKPLLHKYSMENTYYQEWVKSRLLKHDKIYWTPKTTYIKEKTLKGYQFIVVTASNERKQLMEEQFSALNSPVDVHYLDASTPLNSQDYLKDCGKEEREYGVLCCTRSHIRALEYASQNKDKYKYSIILEDDVAFLKNGFLSKIEEVMGNWNKYDTHKMVSIGWVPCQNYETYTNFDETLSNDTIKIITGRYFPGMQGYIVKNDDIPYMDSLVQPTYIEMDDKVKTLDRYKVLATHFGEKQNTVAADVLINRLFSQAIVFPPLMIERDIPSMLGHNNINDYWANYFKGHETERDKYRLSTKKTTLELVDKLVENEKQPLDTQYQQFNNSRKIKCLWLRYIDDKSSWSTDTTKLWGPDVEAEYIVDILTDDGNKDNIEFLSVPSNFNVSLIKNVDVIAYSSNIYNVDYISKLVDILKPKALIHLSDEFGERPQYKEVFDKVQLVYRQYKFPNKNEYHDEINDTSIKYLPLGYHCWGKKYIRGQSILSNQRKYKWCFSGSVKNERTSQIEKLSRLTPYFCKNTNAFESTEMFRNSLFAFCPSGNSNIECSRIYEAMYNGCIPIIVGDKDKHNLEYFKNMFEIPLPCYFVYSMDEAISIIQSTDIDEVIKTQEHCLQWVQNIGDKIRHEIISKCHTENNLHNNSTEPRNVFLYWVGKEYKLISILRNLIYLHSTNGKGYKVNLITDKNISDYIKNIPDYFSTLCPAHQADFVRVNVICDYGGIWLDSDTIVLQSLDSLFDFIKSGDGFFIKENNTILWNGIFGSKANTPLMVEWKKQMINLLDVKMGKIGWTDIGNNMLQNIYNNKTTSFFDNYNIFNGLNNLYPVEWQNCVTEFIEKPYENYKTIIREYQPLVVLVNSVYKKLEYKTEKEILEGNMPVNYFINKSFDNMKLIDYDFIEIGTSNFDTLIQSADDNTVGISVDAVKYYIDKLPDKLNCKKINVGISNINSTLDVYYIPENIIEQNNLPYWFKGCNCINNYHPLHIHHNVSHLCKIDKVNVITTDELFYQNNVRNVKYLKIDTEGHDTIILKQLFLYIKYLPIVCYPNKILYETNEHSISKEVDEVIQLYCSIGYKLESRGYDTVLIL